MSTQVCNHGFWLDHCALCLKLPGECDFGSCTEPATTILEYRRANGTVTESRPMCAGHANGTPIIGKVAA